MCNGAGEHGLFAGVTQKVPPCILALTWGDLGKEGPGLRHTHGAGFIPEEVDGVKAVLVQAVEAVALVPALREDVEADHASCRGWDMDKTGRGEAQGGGPGQGPSFIQPLRGLLRARHRAWHRLRNPHATTIQ